MSNDPAAELPFHLRGNYAPVTEEVTAFDLPVEGAIPEALRGLYLRNGPNPHTGTSGHWFSGDGMIHGVRLEDGRAAWYRNRYVQTRALLEEDAAMIGEDGTADRTIAVANTNVIGHAQRIYALVESSFPTELTPELETLGTRDFDGRLSTAMTAHPKACPDTGELHFFGYGFFAPFLTYHVLDADGKLIKSEEISVPAATMIHDFAITRDSVVFMDLPVVFNIETAMAGRSMPYEWSDDYGARLGVMPRGGSDRDVVWFDIDPCYIFHPFNAFEREGKLILDACRYDELWRGGSARGFNPARAHRYTLDLGAGTVSEQRLDDRGTEFPRIDDRLGGHANRYGYAAWNDSTDESIQIASIVKYDLESGASESHDFGPGRQPGEAVFVPAGPEAGEDEGYLLCYVYDAARNGSDFVVLAAQDISAPPLATVRLPQRVPFGFHGNWIPD